MNVIVSLSATPIAHPPRSNPLLRSSSDAPPFPCITRGVHKFGPPGRICQLAGRNRFSHRIAAETLIQPPAPGPSREISLSTWARKRVRLAKVERTPGRASSETTQPPDRDPRGKISRCFRRLLIGSGLELTHPTGRLGRATLIPRSTH